MPESDVDSNTSRRHKKSKTSATPAERQQPESGGNHLLRVLLSDPRSVKIVMEWLDDNPPNLYHTQLRNFESTKAELDRLKDKLRSQERSRKDASTYQQRWTLLERLAHRSEDGGAEERDWLDMARWSRGLYPLLLALQSDEGSRRPSVVPSSTTHTSAMHTALNGGEQLTSRIQTLVSDAGQPPCYVILGDLSEDPLEPVAFIFDVDFPTKFLKDPVSSTHDARVTQSVLRILAIQQRVADGPSVSQPADIVPLLIEMDAHDHIPDHYLDRSINQPPIASDNTRQLPILWGIVKCPEDWAVLIHVDRQYHEITIYSIEDRPNKQAVIIRVGLASVHIVMQSRLLMRSLLL
ncbi:hypothetical protein IAU59_007627 [Kwoniella sp. CBS 9459]